MKNWGHGCTEMLMNMCIICWLNSREYWNLTTWCSHNKHGGLSFVSYHKTGSWWRYALYTEHSFVVVLSIICPWNSNRMVFHNVYVLLCLGVSVYVKLILAVGMRLGINRRCGCINTALTTIEKSRWLCGQKLQRPTGLTHKSIVTEHVKHG